MAPYVLTAEQRLSASSGCHLGIGKLERVRCSKTTTYRSHDKSFIQNLQILYARVFRNRNRSRTSNAASACDRNPDPRHYRELLNVAYCAFEWNHLPARDY